MRDILRRNSGAATEAIRQILWILRPNHPLTLRRKRALRCKDNPFWDLKSLWLLWPPETRVAPRFYRDTLGLPLVSEDEFALVFDAAGTMLRVTRVQELAAAKYTVLGWRVRDIVQTATDLQKAHVAQERYPGMQQDELGIWTSP
jgi:hypothetical protein